MVQILANMKKSHENHTPIFGKYRQFLENRQFWEALP
jgi:hypothetical protein